MLTLSVISKFIAIPSLAIHKPCWLVIAYDLYSNKAELKSDGEVSTNLSSAHAFVLKRGCYPSMD
ncbi:MAG: hypothetical protein B7Y39_08940 [Bdellovibrio sp. 28-41-41]|nr:MAG: hypothetical protein B7Y39_08940 [Bdellovibrio sp. 28-41-41]